MFIPCYYLYRSTNPSTSLRVTSKDLLGNKFLDQRYQPVCKILPDVNLLSEYIMSRIVIVRDFFW